ncbi:MAG TPA: zinc ribbon domain-containing protein, partial [Planctomycetota bacterium]|nr:zinc ribbon domain-containing protein [Planctomycetota bacterium]
MPTYDYACRKCGDRFERFQSMKDAPLVVCPKCKAKALERLIGAGGGFIFKGGGFYQTDYRNPSYETSKKADEAPKPSDAG